MIEVQHATGKAGIRALGKLKGLGNGDTLTIDSRDFEPGSLVFLGFVAPPPADLSPGEKTWHGVLRFAEAPGEDEVPAEAYRAPFKKYLKPPARRSKPGIEDVSIPEGSKP